MKSSILIAPQSIRNCAELDLAVSHNIICLGYPVGH